MTQPEADGLCEFSREEKDYLQGLVVVLCIVFIIIVGIASCIVYSVTSTDIDAHLANANQNSLYTQDTLNTQYENLYALIEHALPGAAPTHCSAITYDLANGRVMCDGRVIASVTTNARQ